MASKTYKVRAGDTYTSIAKAVNDSHRIHPFQVSVASLKESNPGVDESNLQIGKVLNILPKSYKVTSGDTFEKLSSMFDVSVGDLEAANPGMDPTKLQPGTMIHIPSE